MRSLEKVDLLILDDWGLSRFTDEQRKDFLEVMEDRYERGSTIITSQIPVAKWHAILDRVVHNSYRIELSGESMRKKAKGEEKKAE